RGQDERLSKGAGFRPMRATWGRSTVGDITTQCDYGLSCSLSGDAEGVPVLRMGNLKGGRVSLSDLKYVATTRVTPKDLLQRGDLLLNRTNSAALVGKVGLFTEEATTTFASYVFRLRADTAKVHPAR